MKEGVIVDVLKRGTMLIALLSVFAVSACGRDNEGEVRRAFTPSVTVMEAANTTADIFQEYPARIHGSRQVQVRAMVQGILTKKLYREGQVVPRDTVLFLIDPEPYEIALRRARAEAADASANHGNALRERERYARLHAQKAVSTQELERAETQYELARARLERAEAAVDDAQRNLRYTEVRAPVGGVTDMESVSEGNLIEWGRLLTTITQIDPVHVMFSFPERDAMTQRAAMARDPGEHRHREARLVLADGSVSRDGGGIDFKASTIDPRTGAVNARAVFPNPDGMLVPGQFVRARVLLDRLHDVVLVPEKAVSQGQEGPRLFVVDEENMAKERTVRLGPVFDGLQTILAGIHEGERVVVEGHVALRNDMKVSIGTIIDSPSQPGEVR